MGSRTDLGPLEKRKYQALWRVFLTEAVVNVDYIFNYLFRPVG
jgi:hypothetical protein